MPAAHPKVAAPTVVLALGLGVLALLSPAARDPHVEHAGTTGRLTGLTAPEVLDRALSATKGAPSLRVEVARGRTGGGATRAFLSVGPGGRCAGTLTVGTAGTVELIRTGDDAYVRFDEAYLRAERAAGGQGSPHRTERVLTMLRGRWLRTDPADPAPGGGPDPCDLEALLADVEANAVSARRAGHATVDGRSALRLTVPARGATTTAYVAAEGEPYLLRTETRGGAAPGTVSLTASDDPAGADPPAPRDVVDLGPRRGT
ncbi:hypothetical protein [Streptomyces sp. DH12]|uniref:hypothetical protein n=1 Tax=Streptomyces sp. DH12 TaxID=2857010 RepID=UPI001E38E9D7|nr:hypothetical protein [Streptomyces sp. DH12]